MIDKEIIGKEFHYTTWGMTRTSSHGSIDQKWLIEEVDSNYCKCRLIWNSERGNVNSDLYQPYFKSFLITEIKDRLV